MLIRKKSMFFEKPLSHLLMYFFIAIFSMSCTMYENWSDAPLLAHERSSQTLENVNYWQTEKAHFWQIDEGGCIIQQSFDGYVSVERKYGSELFTLKTSPGNGKARLQSSFIYITASEGSESHLFVKTKDRRIHHSAKVCVINKVAFFIHWYTR